MVAPALTQGFGYGIILGLGAAFGEHNQARASTAILTRPVSTWHDLYHLGSEAIQQ